MLEAEGEETEAELDERRDRIARSQADATMRDFLGSKKGQESVIADTCLFLLRAVERDTLAAAAGELLLQGVVLAWGAFEVLARDCFVHFLNAKPDAVQRLLIDPSAKKRLDLGKVPLETLAAHGFDLSAKMGSLLAEQQDLSDIRSVKAVYGALFPNSPALRDALNSASLRLLSLRRNLVVHRRGIIDDTYRRGADEGAALGSRLVVSPQTLERHLSACLAAGRELLLMVSAG